MIFNLFFEFFFGTKNFIIFFEKIFFFTILYYYKFLRILGLFIYLN